MLAPTPPEKLVDDTGRPYFLWDCDVTLEGLRAFLRSDDLEALVLIATDEMRALWPKLERFLGKSRPFWRWLLERI